MNVRWLFLLFVASLSLGVRAQTIAPVPVATNITIRVMAANLTSGNNQRYETPDLNIMKGLKPDVVAIQEFSYSSAVYGLNSPSGFREMINNTFGTNYVYFRESGASIPNGVISRFPIVAGGIWDDPQLEDREFAWARLDIPGTNDLYVVSVHLHGNGGPSSRQIEASAIKGYVQTNFPANAYVVVAGDFNTDSRSEAAISTFSTFLSDAKKPADQAGDQGTNSSREKPYDYVLASFSLSSNQVATVIGNNSSANGLVFDSRVYTPLSSVAPVTSTDSAAVNMQHMAVVKDFRIHFTGTNYVVINPPQVSVLGTNAIRWTGAGNVAYSVLGSTNLAAWDLIGSASSSSNVITFPLTNPPIHRSFYRVRYP